MGSILALSTLDREMDERMMSRRRERPLGLPDCLENASTDAVFSSRRANRWFEDCSLEDFFLDKFRARQEELKDFLGWSNWRVCRRGTVNASVVADGSALGCDFSGLTVTREVSWGRLVLGLFLALTSVKKVHCRPRIAGVVLFTEVCLPASSFSSEVGTGGEAKSLVCAYVTSSSSFVLELVVPKRDQASVKRSRNKSLSHAQFHGICFRVNRSIEFRWHRGGWEKKEGRCTHLELTGYQQERNSRPGKLGWR